MTLKSKLYQLYISEVTIFGDVFLCVRLNFHTVSWFIRQQAFLIFFPYTMILLVVIFFFILYIKVLKKYFWKMELKDTAKRH